MKILKIFTMIFKWNFFEIFYDFPMNFFLKFYYDFPIKIIVKIFSKIFQIDP